MRPAGWFSSGVEVDLELLLAVLLADRIGGTTTLVRRHATEFYDGSASSGLTPWSAPDGKTWSLRCQHLFTGRGSQDF